MREPGYRTLGARTFVAPLACKNSLKVTGTTFTSVHAHFSNRVKPSRTQVCPKARAEPQTRLSAQFSASNDVMSARETSLVWRRAQ